MISVFDRMEELEAGRCQNQTSVGDQRERRMMMVGESAQCYPGHETQRVDYVVTQSYKRQRLESDTIQANIHHNNNIVSMKDADASYSLLGYSGAGYDGGEGCDGGEHYLHAVRLQHVARGQTQEHRRPGKYVKYFLVN